MQIIESSIFGLRSAQHRFSSPDGCLTVSLFPMVHIGEADFYREVYADAFNQDVVLIEGVRSPVTRVITSSYRWMNLATLGLILQPRRPETATARVVHADLSTAEFHAEWRKVPLWLRIAVLVVMPLFALRQRFVASRESVASKAEMEDRLSSDEVLRWDPRYAALSHCIIAARDARLVACLQRELEQMADRGESRLAVVYGAGHMRAVLGELRKRGFRPLDAKWRTIFAF